MKMPKRWLRPRGRLALASYRVGTTRGVGASSLGSCPRVVEAVRAERESRGVERAGVCAEDVRVALVAEVQAVCRAGEPGGREAQGKGSVWRRQQVDRARVLRVLREMKWWYETRGRVW